MSTNRTRLSEVARNRAVLHEINSSIITISMAITGVLAIRMEPCTARKPCEMVQFPSLSTRLCQKIASEVRVGTVFVLELGIVNAFCGRAFREECDSEKLNHL